jgi:cytoskeleton protein RodZ
MKEAGSMSEPSDALEAPAIASEGAGVEPSAGGLLRAAREAQGMDINVLAALLKVNPRRLEALEADEWEGARGLTFERALAQAACRALKVDPARVLARLPRTESHPLDRVGGGLNAPFREHGSKLEMSDDHARRRGVWLILAVLSLAAGAMWLLPKAGGPWEWLSHHLWASPSVPNTPSEEAPRVGFASALSPPEATKPAVVVAPGLPAARASGPGLPASASGVGVAVSLPRAASVPLQAPLVVRVRAESWVEVVDGAGKALLARNVAAGEALSLDGVLPLRVKIGNAAATEVFFRGENIDLSTQSKDNVARLELK